MRPWSFRGGLQNLSTPPRTRRERCMGPLLQVVVEAFVTGPTVTRRNISGISDENDRFSRRNLRHMCDDLTVTSHRPHRYRTVLPPGVVFKSDKPVRGRFGSISSVGSRSTSGPGGSGTLHRPVPRSSSSGYTLQRSVSLERSGSGDAEWTVFKSVTEESDEERGGGGRSEDVDEGEPDEDSLALKRSSSANVPQRVHEVLSPPSSLKSTWRASA